MNKNVKSANPPMDPLSHTVARQYQECTFLGEWIAS